jgi:hypothetical protein
MTTMSTLLQHCGTLVELIRLPVARLQFDARIDPENISSTYRNFTMPHPRYRIISNKTVGAALVDLHQFTTREQYFELIKSYKVRRARSRGYVVTEIDRNRFIDDIHEINTAIEVRQGRPMGQNYRDKKTRFDCLSHFHYYGVLNPAGKLMAYANIGRYGNFCAFTQLLGHRNNDGAMHLLITEIVARLIDEGTLCYAMYDTYYGAQPGLRQFKKDLGFRPYLAKYTLL